MSLVNWVKTHKLVTVLALIIAFFLLRETISSSSRVSSPSADTYSGKSAEVSSPSTAESTGFSLTNPLKSTSETTTSESDRVVIKNSNLSLLVKDVASTNDKILNYAEGAGGYMVSTSFTRSDKSPYATITVRVPTSKLDEALKYFRSLAIKVTSENLVGTDVTDEYTDIKANLATLEKTKAKFEGILDKATEVQDILTVQEKIIYVQNQIDSLKGQQKEIEQNAALTKITLYISTDELALPYTPDKAFRPNVVFRQAVRSMLGNLRDIGEFLIWVGVYSVIWVPALIVFLGYCRWRHKKSLPQQT